MWMSILFLGLVINGEPTRLALLPLLLLREKPLWQLLAFLAGSLTSSLSCGSFIIYMLQQDPSFLRFIRHADTSMAFGAILLLIACFMLLHWVITRRPELHSATEAPPSHQGTRPRRTFHFADSLVTLIQKSHSPWHAALIGVGTGLPSADSLGVLVIIASTEMTFLQQVGALFAFVFAGNLVVLAPLMGFLFSPAKTVAILTRFGLWTRSRHPLAYAGLLACLGCVFILIN
jgi:hypothetical protein